MDDNLTTAKEGVSWCHRVFILLRGYEAGDCTEETAMRDLGSSASLSFSFQQMPKCFQVSPNDEPVQVIHIPWSSHASGYTLAVSEAGNNLI